MTLELRVPGRQQATQMSCWWACMAMVLEYYGRDVDFPWQYRAEFRRPLSLMPRGLDPDWHQPTLDEAMAEDGTIRADHLVYIEPHEWYERGLPPRRGAFERLASITEFRALPNRPAFGQWTAGDVETTLRRHGPLVFFGSWNGFPHAIVTVGLIEDPSLGAQVVTIDPVRGHATGEDLAAFNGRMTTRMATCNFPMNPMYLPRDPQVRDVINH